MKDEVVALQRLFNFQHDEYGICLEHPCSWGCREGYMSHDPESELYGRIAELEGEVEFVWAAGQRVYHAGFLGGLKAAQAANANRPPAFDAIQKVIDERSKLTATALDHPERRLAEINGEFISVLNRISLLNPEGKAGNAVTLAKSVLQLAKDRGAVRM